MDFELVAGCKPLLAASQFDVLNASHNWWGMANEAELGQRIFDVDDWNSLSRAEFSPFYTTEEQFINFWWWDPAKARLSFAQNGTDPPAHDLRGRLWTDKKLELDPERWLLINHIWDCLIVCQFQGIPSPTIIAHFGPIGSPGI